MRILEILILYILLPYVVLLLFGEIVRWTQRKYVPDAYAWLVVLSPTRWKSERELCLAMRTRTQSTWLVDVLFFDDIRKLIAEGLVETTKELKTYGGEQDVLIDVYRLTQKGQKWEDKQTSDSFVPKISGTM